LPIPIEREDLHLGGAYDEAFLGRHICGECGGPLGIVWKDNQWWLRCFRDWDHGSFEKQPSWTELWKRGENPMAEVIHGPYPGWKALREGKQKEER